MFGSIFVRMLWKEYRTQRGLWLGVAGCTAVTQLAIHWLVRGPDRTSELGLLALVGLLALLMYVASSSALLFGSELEEGTLTLLRSWGLRFSPFLFGKLAFGLVGTVVLTATLVASTCVAFGQWVSPVELASRAEEYLGTGWTVREWQRFSLLRGILPLVVACILISVLTRRVLLTVLATFCVMGVGVVLPDLLFVWPIVAALDVWLLRREIVGVRERVSLVAPRWFVRARTASTAWSRPPDVGSSAARMLRRLAWQEFRHAASATAWFLGGVGILVACGILAVNESPLEFILLFGVPAAAFLTTLVFHSEQRQSLYRFHSERGAEPWLVWFGKHVVWFPTVTLPILLLGIALYFYGCYRQNFYIAPTWTGVTAVWLAYLLIYSCGQFCSLLVPRTLTAALVSIPVDAVLLLWLSTMVQLQVPLVLSVLPIPLILFLASLTAANVWIDERRGWKTKASPLLIVLAGVIATFGTVAIYRAQEISWSDAIVDENRDVRKKTVEAVASETERNTLSLYRQAYAKSLNTSRLKFAPHWGGVSPVFDASRYDPELNRLARALTREATQQVSIGLFSTTDVAPADGSLPLPSKMQQLCEVLYFEADYLSSKGELDQALAEHLAILRVARQLATAGGIVERRQTLELEEAASVGLLSWAVQPGQTHSRIRAALGRLKLELDQFPRPDVTIRNEYVLRQRVLRERLDLLLAGWPSDTGNFGYRYSLRIPWKLPPALLLPLLDELPWEHKRARDLLQHRSWADKNLAYYFSGETTTWYWHTLRRMSDGSSTFYWWSPNHPGYANLATSTPLIERLMPQAFPEIAKLEIDLETRRQALLTVLALCGWRLEHGGLPDSLHSLVGTYCKELPIDPASGSPFEYFAGKPEDIARPDFTLDTGEKAQDPKLFARLVSVGVAARDWNNTAGDSVKLTEWNGTVRYFPLQETFRIPAPAE